MAQGLLYFVIATTASMAQGVGQVMSTHFYSCRHLLGLQVQRFVEQQQVSLKWITQGLSNSGRRGQSYPSQTTLQLRYRKSLVSPTHPIHLSDIYVH
jgi:hypothetical protein